MEEPLRHPGEREDRFLKLPNFNLHRRLNTELLSDSAIPLLGIYLRDRKHMSTHGLVN